MQPLDREVYFQDREGGVGSQQVRLAVITPEIGHIHPEVMPDDLAEQTFGHIFSTMVGNRRLSPIWMNKTNMRSFLTNGLEAQSLYLMNQPGKGYNRPEDHIAN